MFDCAAYLDRIIKGAKVEDIPVDITKHSLETRTRQWKINRLIARGGKRAC
jgi:hypothetical protein